MTRTGIRAQRLPRPPVAETQLAMELLSETKSAKRMTARGVIAALSWPSAGLVVFLAGYNGLFLLPLVFPAAAREELFGVQRYYLLCQGLILFGAAIEAWTSRLRLVRSYPVWHGLLAVTVLGLAARAYLTGVSAILIALRLLPFCWLLVVPAVPLQKQGRLWLWTSLAAQALVAIPYALQAILVKEAASRTAIAALEGQNFLVSSLYFGPALLLFVPTVRGAVGMLLGVTAFVGHVAVGLLFGNRLTLLLVPLEIGMLAFVLLKGKVRSAGSVISLSAVVGALLLQGSLWALTESRIKLPQRFEEAQESLVSRLLEKGSLVDTILQNERWLEARSSMRTMAGVDWLIGKGIDPEWSDPEFLNGDLRFMVHNTWLNGLLWGGFPLLMALLFPLAVVFTRLRQSRQQIALCAAATLAVTLARFPAYLLSTGTLEWALFCLILGMNLAQHSPPLDHRGFEATRGIAAGRRHVQGVAQ